MNAPHGRSLVCYESLDTSHMLPVLGHNRSLCGRDGALLSVLYSKGAVAFSERRLLDIETRPGSRRGTFAVWTAGVLLLVLHSNRVWLTHSSARFSTCTQLQAYLGFALPGDGIVDGRFVECDATHNVRKKAAVSWVRLCMRIPDSLLVCLSERRTQSAS